MHTTRHATSQPQSLSINNNRLRQDTTPTILPLHKSSKHHPTHHIEYEACKEPSTSSPIYNSNQTNRQIPHRTHAQTRTPLHLMCKDWISFYTGCACKIRQSFKFCDQTPNYEPCRNIDRRTFPLEERDNRICQRCQKRLRESSRELYEKAGKGAEGR